ncbi:GrpB family protein [Ethanoligenens sp.]|uniref:GrpB family protein n=1 Tax=Ethanoligenens sp. TaxID=2099655 RepID=UPI0039E81322
MSKPLSEMSLEELWKLFPIQLTEHHDCWKEWYQTEKAYLLSVLPDKVKIHHIGSTSINGIWAKPIVDILVEANLNNHHALKSTLVKNGYICMAQAETRIDFNKGYTPNGFAEKVFHLHLRELGDNDELYFRDYLNEHQNTAKSYEKLKLSLWKKFEHNRDGYTDSKTEFVREYTYKAILQYGEIYK